MSQRKAVREEALVPVELYARGKIRAALLVDLSIGGAMLEVPGDLELADGEAVLVRLIGLASAMAHVRWSTAGSIGVEFRHELDPSVVDFTVHNYVKTDLPPPTASDVVVAIKP